MASSIVRFREMLPTGKERAFCAAFARRSLALSGSVFATPRFAGCFSGIGLLPVESYGELSGLFGLLPFLLPEVKKVVIDADSL